MEIPAARAEVETVITARTAADGGPFQTLTCRGCRTQCGALRNRRGEWMLYPLEGTTEPTLIDCLVPRTSRAHSQRARQWWLLNSRDVERFRTERVEPRSARRGARERPSESRREPPVPPNRPSARDGPRAVLGVAQNATLRDVQRAWRAAVKRWHPDRIPTTDPVVVAEAQRRFHELRAAYEELVAELSG